MDETKKISIVIWGCNHFSAQLVKYLAPTNISVEGFVDENPPTIFESKPTFTPENFKAQQQFTTTPIVLANLAMNLLKLPKIDFESIYQFKLKIRDIKGVYQIENHILHPSALLDFMDLNFANKVITFGPPGSGITLLTHICDRIMAARKLHFITKNRINLFWQKLAIHYQQCLLQLLPDLMHANGGMNFHMSSWKLGTSYAISYFQHTRAEIYCFNTRNHICGNVYTYHYLPDQSTLEHLKSQHFKMFFNMRNPLDMILSCMNKADGVNEQKDKVNRKALWFYAKMMIEQLNSLHPVPKELIFFNYEKLIAEPIDTIRALAKQLGVWISKRRADKIWEELSFKSLPQAPSRHFWHGGCGKWEKYFSEDDLAILRSLGIEQVLEKFQYIDTLNRFREKCKSSIEKVHVTVEEQINDKFYHDRKDISSSTMNYLSISCNNEDVRNKICQAFTSSYLKDLILAGAHPDYRYI